ncbi:hypothetical protein ACTXT7_013897 [Hymenolepis weldensis]
MYDNENAIRSPQDEEGYAGRNIYLGENSKTAAALQPNVLVEAGRNNVHAGVKAQTKSGIVTLLFPIECGIITK